MPSRILSRDYDTILEVRKEIWQKDSHQSNISTVSPRVFSQSVGKQLRKRELNGLVNFQIPEIDVWDCLVETIKVAAVLIYDSLCATSDVASNYFRVSILFLKVRTVRGSF